MPADCASLGSRCPTPRRAVPRSDLTGLPADGCGAARHRAPTRGRVVAATQTGAANVLGALTGSSCGMVRQGPGMLFGLC